MGYALKLKRGSTASTVLPMFLDDGSPATGITSWTITKTYVDFDAIPGDMPDHEVTEAVTAGTTFIEIGASGRFRLSIASEDNDYVACVIRISQVGVESEEIIIDGGYPETWYDIQKDCLRIPPGGHVNLKPNFRYLKSTGRPNHTGNDSKLGGRVWIDRSMTFNGNNAILDYDANAAPGGTQDLAIMSIKPQTTNLFTWRFADLPGSVLPERGDVSLDLGAGNVVDGLEDDDEVILFVGRHPADYMDSHWSGVLKVISVNQKVRISTRTKTTEVATGGSFILTFRGFDTAPIAYDASSQDIVDALLLVNPDGATADDIIARFFPGRGSDANSPADMAGENDGVLGTLIELAGIYGQQRSVETGSITIRSDPANPLVGISNGVTAVHWEPLSFDRPFEHKILEDNFGEGPGTSHIQKVDQLVDNVIINNIRFDLSVRTAGTRPEPFVWLFYVRNMIWNNSEIMYHGSSLWVQRACDNVIFNNANAHMRDMSRKQVGQLLDTNNSRNLILNNAIVTTDSITSSVKFGVHTETSNRHHHHYNLMLHSTQEADRWMTAMVLGGGPGAQNRGIEYNGFTINSVKSNMWKIGGNHIQEISSSVVFRNGIIESPDRHFMLIGRSWDDMRYYDPGVVIQEAGQNTTNTGDYYHDLTYRSSQPVHVQSDVVAGVTKEFHIGECIAVPYMAIYCDDWSKIASMEAYNDASESFPVAVPDVGDDNYPAGWVIYDGTSIRPYYNWQKNWIYSNAWSDDRRRKHFRYTAKPDTVTPGTKIKLVAKIIPYIETMAYTADDEPIGGGGVDWTDTEREQIRQQLGIDGLQSAPAAIPAPGSLAGNVRHSFTAVAGETEGIGTETEKFYDRPGRVLAMSVNYSPNGDRTIDYT